MRARFLGASGLFAIGLLILARAAGRADDSAKTESECSASLEKCNLLLARAQERITGRRSCCPEIGGIPLGRAGNYCQHSTS
jgi:hypothetical protein